jgi:hypothetical protein
MQHARIDITKDVDGHSVVLATLDLDEAEAAAAGHAVAAVRAERYRLAEMSSDDVLAMRELTALADELASVGSPGIRSLVLRPARLTALRDALETFVTSRDDAEWIREEDREPLAAARPLLWPVADLCTEALRAALGTGCSTPAG